MICGVLMIVVGRPWLCATVMAITGRPTALDNIFGPGLDTLRSRLRPPKPCEQLPANTHPEVEPLTSAQVEPD